MSDEINKFRPAPPESDVDPATGEPKPKQDYTVGYKRPPVASRFKPGKSGNPRGRPQGSRSLESLFDGYLNEKFSIREGGKVLKLNGAEIIVRGQFSKAAKGDQAATDRFIAAQKAQEKREQKPITERITQNMSAEKASRVYQRIIRGEE